MERHCNVRFRLSCSIASHSCYLYLKNHLASKLLHQSMSDALGTSVPCLPGWFLFLSPVLQVPRRMWVILGVNAKCLNIEGPARLEAWCKTSTAFLLTSILECYSFRLTLEKPQRWCIHRVCTFVHFLHLPSRLAFASPMFHCAHAHSSWFHLVIMRPSLK